MTREVIPVHLEDLEKVRRLVETTKRTFDGSQASFVEQLSIVADNVNDERDQVEIAMDPAVAEILGSNAKAHQVN